MLRSPIAIVGASCILPGAPNVDAFAQLVLSGANEVKDAPEGRFGIPNAAVLGQGRDRAWSLAGGYVTSVQPSLAGLDVPQWEQLDPLVQWLLHCSQTALAGASGHRTGAVFGNLSFPTDGMAAWGAGVASGSPTGDARNHFMSGLPAAIVANALKLDGGATCVDAACASSLYAIKMACDALQSGRADRMLAGAVQRADSLFLHVGFCQLGAMSKTGRSRPFHAGADGLVPAEGCVVFNLRRLDDAIAAGEPIWGVIRGVGLSNDGRGRSLLAPSSEGQQRAMRAALAEAGWAPESVQLFECHATGTPTGDRVELDSLQAVYPGGALGSLKSNLGHLITTAGAAGLLKVLLAMRDRTMPPTLHVDEPLEQLGGFRLLARPEPWSPAKGQIRRAAVSAFGFGGNNGHLLVEEYLPDEPSRFIAPRALRQPLAIVALVDHRGGHEAVLGLEGLRFPPTDLAASLAQQAWMLQAGRDAWTSAELHVSRERLGVYVGMGCDGLVTRWGQRWRTLGGNQAGRVTGDTSSDTSSDTSRLADRIAPPLKAEHVVGTMPNIVANRLGVQLDAAGPGFTISAEEVSGLRALEAAWDALDRGEIDAAIVGAVDLAREPRAQAARMALGETAEVGDAVVALVLVRAADTTENRAVGFCDDTIEGPVAKPHPPRYGAADGLVTLADAIRRGGPAVVQVKALGGQRSIVGVRGGKRRAEPKFPPPLGPLFRVPLHPTESTPPSSSSPSLRSPEPALTPSRRLPLPPPLVPVLGHRTQATSVPAPMGNSTPPVGSPEVAAVPVPASLVHSATAGGAAEAFVTLTGATANAHMAFLQQQSLIHQTYLDHHQRVGARFWSSVAAATGEATYAIEAEPSPVAIATSAGVRENAAPPSQPIPVPSARAEIPPSPLPSPAPSGFHLSRAQLEMGACGSISTIFGDEFSELDGYRRVVRMPAPPLLLADRVIDLQGPKRVLGKGSIVTETDIKPESWYLHDGRMPGGLMIESGQADLLLGSWQGIDWLNQGERIYRLLGCTLTYLGELPKVGETLRYDIHIDQHAKLGDVRMFFFRYDCHVAGSPRLQVREGQAGFFSDEELANSGGCLWDAPEYNPGSEVVDPPLATPTRTQLGRDELDALAAGNLEAAFGPAFARAHTHTLTPRIAGGRQTLFDRVELDLAGGPWKRGYLRAELDIRPDLWFFHGHFHNDPCMPGTLMMDGCLNAMYVLLAAGGHTLHRDGWRFEPGKDIPFKLRCRGQVTPSSKHLTYEIFVTGFTAGPVPRLTAQVLCTVDGLKCFHADPMVVELVPGWPLDRPDFRAKALPAGTPSPEAAYDYASLLACAWGKPTDAFGPMYQCFDGPRKVPRLPGPPYHFMSRVLSTTGEMGAKKGDCSAVVEYDVPPDAWYFNDNGHPVMPWAVLLEAALQPCGWLASWTGSAVGPDDFLFRNLDGTATIHREVGPTTGTLTTVAKLDRVSKSGGMILVNFTVTVDSPAGRVVDMKTVFGFFPPEAFVNQVGVGSTEAQRALLNAAAEPVLMEQPDGPKMAERRLMMLDRAYRINADTYRGEKDVSAKDWFFAAHFYQDPVQPGSLGIEALLQLLQVAMADRGLGKGLKRPRFEPTASGEAQTWKYRGQVVPENKLIQSDVHILEIREEAGAVLAIAEGALWVDGKRIYAMPRFAMRVCEDDRPARITLGVPSDHCPTWTLPSAPMMTMALAALAQRNGNELRDGIARRWLTFPEGLPREIDVSQQDSTITLGEKTAPYFVGTVGDATEAAPKPSALINPREPQESAAALYQSGRLFHGPGFQALQAIVKVGENGATGLLRAGLAPDVLLDGMTHLVPHDDMQAWFPSLPAKHAAYPAKLRRLTLHSALPNGESRVEVRALGLENGRPLVGAWLFDGETLVVSFELEEVLLPKGRVGEANPADRRMFLTRRYIENVSLGKVDGESVLVSKMDVKGSDWLPGTISAVYGTDDAASIAVKEAVARKLACHPGFVELAPNPTAASGGAEGGGSPAQSVRATAAESTTTGVAFGCGQPVHGVRYSLEQQPTGFRATALDRGSLNLDRVSAWWRTHNSSPAWPGESILAALCTEFLEGFYVHDPEALHRLNQPVLFLANHENYLESVIFSALAAAIFDRPLRAVAKVEHQTRWLGRLHALLTGYPGMNQDPQITWFDQGSPATLRPALDAVPAGTSLLVHVEGTRQVKHGENVSRISSIWTDFAADRGWAIVPVAFRGGTNGEKTDVPVAKQRHHVGAPLLPTTLAAMPYAARRQAVADAINALPHGDPSGATVTTIANPGKAIVDAVQKHASVALEKAHPDWAARFRAL